MQLRAAKHLEDIRDASDFVLSVTRERALSEYLGDRLLRQAVERNFEIVGEALNRLKRENPETAERISESPRIIGIR